MSIKPRKNCKSTPNGKAANKGINAYKNGVALSENSYTGRGQEEPKAAWAKGWRDTKALYDQKGDNLYCGRCKKTGMHYNGKQQKFICSVSSCNGKRDQNGKHISIGYNRVVHGHFGG